MSTKSKLLSDSGINKRKLKEESKEEHDDKLTDDFSASEGEGSKIKEQEKVQMNLRNVPIPTPPISNAKVRTIYTLLMLFVFVLIIAAGPFYCTLMIIAVSAGIYKEIINLKRKISREAKIPYFILINWYFFMVGIFYFYGGFLVTSLEQTSSLTAPQQFFMKYHKFLSFIFWIIGFLGFVLSLAQGFYRYQFRLFGWTHLTILIVVAQTSTIVINLYKGLSWFILPTLLVITNDIFAYVFGKLFGRTKLIDLSPNKTWEGFIGGFFSSLFIAVLFSYFFQMFQSLVCPNNFYEITPFVYSSCTIPDLFIGQPYPLPSWFQIVGVSEFFLSDFQKHSLILSLFASLIGPFGGFFASGFKRALQVKDFGQIIPGHGGMTDRMDCQLLMGTFTYCYLNYVVLQSSAVAIPGIIAGFKLLSEEEQKEVLEKLTSIVTGGAK